MKRFILTIGLLLGLADTSFAQTASEGPPIPDRCPSCTTFVAPPCEVHNLLTYTACGQQETMHSTIFLQNFKVRGKHYFHAVGATSDIIAGSNAGGPCSFLPTGKFELMNEVFRSAPSPQTTNGTWKTFPGDLWQSDTADVDMRAGRRVILKNGFRAHKGVYLHAYVAPKWTEVWRDDFSDEAASDTKWLRWDWVDGGRHEDFDVSRVDIHRTDPDDPEETDDRIARIESSVTRQQLFNVNNRLTAEQMFDYQTGGISTTPLVDQFYQPIALPDKLEQVGSTYEGYSHLYGRFEGRMKFPVNPGAFPAFWLASGYGFDGANGGGNEFDIFEHASWTIHHTDLGHCPNYTMHTMQGKYGGSYPYYNPDNPDYENTYHTWAFEWEPGVLRWLVDDKIIFRLKENNNSSKEEYLNAALKAVPKPMHIIINNAFHDLDGSMEGGLYTNRGAGENVNFEPDAVSETDIRNLDVDYVRVLERENCIPRKSFIYGPSTVCPSSMSYTKDYYVASGCTDGVTFTWSISGPGTLSTTTGDKVVVTFTGSSMASVTLSVLATKGGNAAPLASMVITKNTTDILPSFQISTPSNVSTDQAVVSANTQLAVSTPVVPSTGSDGGVRTVFREPVEWKPMYKGSGGGSIDWPSITSATGTLNVQNSPGRIVITEYDHCGIPYWNHWNTHARQDWLNVDVVGVPNMPLICLENTVTNNCSDPTPDPDPSDVITFKVIAASSGDQAELDNRNLKYYFEWQPCSTMTPAATLVWDEDSDEATLTLGASSGKLVAYAYDPMGEPYTSFVGTHSQTASALVQVTGSPCVAIKKATDFTSSDINAIEQNWNSNLTISPNPSSGKLVIDMVSPEIVQRAQVIDVTGKTVLEFVPSKHVELDLQHLPNGSYMVVFTTSTFNASRRIELQR